MNMKQLVTCIIALIAMAFPFAVSAQNKDYNRAEVTYTRTWADHTGEQNLDFDLNGIGVSYMHGFSLSQTVPIFLEVGGKFTTYFSSSDEHDLRDAFNLQPNQKMDINLKSTMLNIAVPVYFGYRFNLGNTCNLMPYVGLYGRAHLWAKSKADYKLWTNDRLVAHDKTENNPLKKDDNGKTPLKRFQAGWVIGANFQYKPITLGFNFGTGFIKTRDNYTVYEISASVGYCF